MSEWTEWKTHKPGDPCPISDAKAAEYQVRARDGFERTPGHKAPDLAWHENLPGCKAFDIIAYRTLKEPKP